MTGTLKNWARLVERTLAAEGVCLSEELATRNISIDLSDPGRIRGKDALAIWSCAEQATRSDTFGIDVVRNTDYDDFEELGLALAAGGSLEAVIGRIVNFHSYLSDCMVVSSERRQGSVELVLAGSSSRTHPLAHEFGAALVVRVMRARFGRDVDPVRVGVAIEHPRGSKHYPRYFRCPVTVGDDKTRIAYDETLAKATRLVRNPPIAGVLERILADEVQFLAAQDSWSARVSRSLPELLENGNLTLKHVARQLHASERSVQRHLASEGVTFSGLVTDSRKRLAKQLVAEGRHSISEIAYLLGFSSVSGFSRAYKRWYGTSPSSEDTQDHEAQLGAFG